MWSHGGTGGYTDEEDPTQETNDEGGEASSLGQLAKNRGGGGGGGGSGLMGSMAQGAQLYSSIANNALDTPTAMVPVQQWHGSGYQPGASLGDEYAKRLMGY
jgi:hypothetical protein